MNQQQVAIQEILAAEAAWAEAHRKVDVEALEHLMHPDYTIIQPGGKVVGREETLASYRSDTRHWDFAQSDEHQVRIYGKTAIVIGRWKARGTNNGDAFDNAARYTSLWVKREGRWQIWSATNQRQ